MPNRFTARFLLAFSMAAFTVAILGAVWMFSVAKERTALQRSERTSISRIPTTSSPAADKVVRRDSPAAAEAGTPPATVEFAAPALPAVRFARSHDATSDAPSDAMMEGEGAPLKAGPRQPAARHGLLTAGTIDDVLHWDRYLEFLNNSMQSDTNELLPRTLFGHQVVIQVRDPQQRPVHDADRTIKSSQDTLLTCQTGSDGVVHFVQPAQYSPPGLTFTVEKDGERVTGELQKGEPNHVVEMKRCEGTAPTVLELALVIDTTGSMGDELAYLQAEIAHITAQAREMFPNVRQRLALIVYRDNGDQYVMRSFDFTDELGNFRAKLNEQQAAGGGDYPEAMHVALSRARRLEWEEGSARLIFLVGDAPPHDKHLQQSLDYANDFRKDGISVYPIGASGVKHKAEFLMRSMAVTTGGQYLFLTDHSGIGNAHAAPHVDQFDVETLGRAMLRMVASELTGKRLAADEIVAIESGDLHYETLTRDDYAGIAYVSASQNGPSPTATVTAVATQMQSTPPHLPPTITHAYTQYRRPLWRRVWGTLEEHAIWIVVGNFIFGAVFLGLSLRQHLQLQQPHQHSGHPNFLIK